MDLGRERTINGYTICMAGAAGESDSFNAKIMAIQIGTSISGPWATEGYIGNPAQDDIVHRSYTTPVTARYVRLYITDPGEDNIVRLPEFEVIADPIACIGDFDWVDDVDMEDFGHFQSCLSGQGTPQTDPACADARLDDDEDVDQTDLAIFQACFSGPNMPPSPACCPE